MNKKFALIISLLLTLIGTFLLGLYDYKIYYNPEATTGQEKVLKYKSYLSDKTFVADEDSKIQTEKKIELNQLFSNEYISNEPIFTQDVFGKQGSEKLFTIVIYKDVISYTPDANTHELKYRFNTYIYDVNYEKIKELFMGQDLPQDKNIIKEAGYPTILINFFPNVDCNDDESLFYKTASEVEKVKLNNGDTIIRVPLNSTTSFNLHDFGSTPSLDNEEQPFNVNTLAVSAYPNTYENLSLFTGDAFVKVDIIMETTDGSSTVNYLLKDDKFNFQAKVNNFNINEEIKLENYKLGYNTSSSTREVLNNVDIKGVLNYDAWIFTRYIWWQCLICFVVLGIIVGGFFYALTIDVDKKAKAKKNNGKNKNKK